MERYAPGDTFYFTVENTLSISAIAKYAAFKNGSDVLSAITLTIDTTLPASTVVGHFTVPAGYAAGDKLYVSATFTDASGTFNAPIFDEQLVTYSKVGDEVWKYVVENSKQAIHFIRIIKAAIAGKLSGAATTTVTIRDDADSKARITATVDSDGNRSAITLDGT